MSDVEPQTPPGEPITAYDERLVRMLYRSSASWPIPALLAEIDRLRVVSDVAFRPLLIREHRAVVSEWSGNFGGHVAIRDGWADYDAETPIEDCDVCTALVRGTPVPEEATLPSGDARVAGL